MDYWRQSALNTIILLPLEWFGWVTENGKVQVDLDSPAGNQSPSSPMDVEAKLGVPQPDVNASKWADCVVLDAHVPGLWSVKMQDRQMKVR